MKKKPRYENILGKYLKPISFSTNLKQIEAVNSILLLAS